MAVTAKRRHRPLARVWGLGRNFQYASRGVWLARSGATYRIHLIAAVTVAFLAAAYGVTGARLGLVVTSVAIVISAEIMNTAVELTCDLVAELHHLGRDPRIGDIKDLAAGAVLVVAIGAAANGIVVFGPLLV